MAKANGGTTATATAAPAKPMSGRRRTQFVRNVREYIEGLAFQLHVDLEYAALHGIDLTQEEALKECLPWLRLARQANPGDE